MASSKVFTHYNCEHSFPGTVTSKGLLTDAPFPADAADLTTQAPKQGEMRISGARIVIWDTTAWKVVIPAAWA